MNLRIKICAAATAAAMLLVSGCNKKPEETPAPTESSTTVTSETTTESETTETTVETTPAPLKEYGDGEFVVKTNTVILKNHVNIDTVINTYDGIEGLDSGWHGTHWADITKWLTELHDYKIDNDYLKGNSPDYRFHEIKAKNGVTITFVPVKELGTKSYDGFEEPAEVPVNLVNIQITLEDGFKIVIADSGEDAEYDISGSGRGWYMTHDQIAAAEFVLELLEKDASKDPISDMFEHETVSRKNTYTF